MMQASPKRTHAFRRRSRGANLAILAALGGMLVVFMGISLYTGLQAFIQNDLQRITTSAALAGAAAYYSGTEANGKPTPNPNLARQMATNAFNSAVTNGSLNGFNAEIVNVQNNDSNDSITVRTRGRFATPFLAPVGIRAVEAQAAATARALKYEPTQFTGPLNLLPDTTRPESYNQVIELAFPMVDGPGSDLYVEQRVERRGYIVEACNDTECYNIMNGATPVGSSQILPVNGVPALFGTAIFDLGRAGVRKANKLRFTHANNYDGFDLANNPLPLPAAPTPTVIDRVMVFGYAGTCVSPQECQIPAGFMPVE